MRISVCKPCEYINSCACLCGVPSSYSEAGSIQGEVTTIFWVLTVQHTE